MEVRNVSDGLILSKDFPLQQRALHKLVKTFWDTLLVRDKECVFILRESEKLIAHRQKVLRNLPQCLKDLPKRLKTKLINAVYCLEEGYSEAVIWEEKCQCALPFTIFNPAKAGKYKIDNFIDSSGHFNDLEWVKRFVDDETQCVQNRFAFACLYCFDEKIAKLWHAMKTIMQIPCEGRLADIKSKYKRHNLVVSWAYQLENKFDELMVENNSYEYDFNYNSFFDAIIEGHEYAARFFWHELSESEKNNFLEKVEFSLLADAAEGNHAGLVAFIYSLLGEKQKNELIDWLISGESFLSILCCLLQSQYYEIVLNDFLKPSFTIPTQIYQWILESLSFDIVELQNPVHKEIFKELWGCLSQEQRKEVLEEHSCIIMNLVKINAMDLLKMIIQQLSCSEKDRMLFENWQDGGISALDEFSFAGHFIELRRYLLFYLVDYCPGDKKKYSLSSDAFNLFNKFINCQVFKDWIESISDSEVKELNKVIKELRDSLQVTNLLFQEIEEN